MRYDNNMNRPFLASFSAIISKDQLSIRAIVNDSYQSFNEVMRTPISFIKLLTSDNYRLRIRGFNANQTEILSREYDSDSFGNFELRIPAMIDLNSVQKISVYETSRISGLEIHLGSFYPIKIAEPSKILISDFDKTLVDTKYSTPSEMYYSLNRPLSYFPSVAPSITLLKDYIDLDFQPFILSASPHFYEKPIRDWLYQNDLFISNIFLKDYRHFFSLFEGRLSTKDFKKQGFYKLNQLIDILLMTGIPQDLVLVGDGFESDPFIYMVLKNLIEYKADPWKTWKTLKHHRLFSLTNKQDSYFLTKFYQLSELSRKTNEISIKIFIRATDSNIDGLKNRDYGPYSEINQEVVYYLA